MTPREIFDENESKIGKYLCTWGLTQRFLAMKATQSDGALAWQAHYAWAELPDSSKIRYGGFFPLCDIAEHIFHVQDNGDEVREGSQT